MIQQKIIVNTDAWTKIKQGYLWIFSNQILNNNELEKQISLVKIYSQKNDFLSIGVYNPNSLISVRILSNNKDIKFDEDFFSKKIYNAINYRNMLGIDTKYCRIIYGESDFLPGLIIDRYDDVVVVQFYCLGMELFLTEIKNSLIDILNPSCIIVRNDFSLRKYENAKENKEIIYIKKPFTENELKGGIVIEHLNKKYVVDVLEGQKTGFFYDQKNNREYVSKIVKNKSVLDLCCYTGSFSIMAKSFGAKDVLGLDTSQKAIDIAKKNALLNKLSIDFVKEDVEEFIKNEKNKYDVIVFDPPSYCKSKKDKIKSIKKYIKICSELLNLLNNNGILCFSVCSYHITWEDVKNIIHASIVRSKKSGYIINYGMQSLDHPVYSIMKETEYLKFVSTLIK